MVYARGYNITFTKSSCVVLKIILKTIFFFSFGWKKITKKKRENERMENKIVTSAWQPHI